jgi:hypothetical protein
MVGSFHTSFMTTSLSPVEDMLQYGMQWAKMERDVIERSFLGEVIRSFQHVIQPRETKMFKIHPTFTVSFNQHSSAHTPLKANSLP